MEEEKKKKKEKKFIYKPPQIHDLPLESDYQAKGTTPFDCVDGGCVGGGGSADYDCPGGIDVTTP